jgi:biotin carboxyl carrier protein
VAVPPHRRESHRWRWIAGGLVVAAGIAGLVWQRRAAQSEQASRLSATVVRTAPAARGKLERTLRLTGTTGALRFASLTAPMMRGSRGDQFRDGPSGNIGRRSGGDRGGGGSPRGTPGGRGGDGVMMVATVGMGGGGGGFAGGGGDGGERRNTGGAGGAGSSGSAGQATTSSISVSSTSSAMGGSSSLSSSRSSSAMRTSTSRVSSGGSRERTPSARTSGGGAAIQVGGGGQGGSGGQRGSGGPGSGGPRGGGDFGLSLQMVAKAGTIVKPGDVIAEFDRENMQNRLDDYKASLTQSEAGYKAMLADLDVERKAHALNVQIAEGDLEKARINLQTTPVQSAISAEQLKLSAEEAEAQLKQLRNETKYVEIGLQSNVRVADLELRQTRLELQRSEANVNRMVIKAPIEGMVVMENMPRNGEMDTVKVGDSVFPGQPFMRIVDMREMVINALANQVDAEKLRIGQRARVRFDAFPDLELPGRIYSLGTATQASRFRPDWVKQMPVVLKLEKLDPRVIPDLSVSCDVILENDEAEGAIVPREAVFHEGTGGSARPVVYVRLAPGKYERREVELGMVTNVSAAVRRGVNPGEVVALEPPPRAGGALLARS